MKKRKRRTLTTYLNGYYNIQDQIVLVSRLSPATNWSDRCLFLDEQYDCRKHYNHRSILRNEVVIEFDDSSTEKNREYADVVRKRLKADGFVVAQWYSGGKSTHLHTFIDPKECGRVPLLKNVFIRHYCKDLPLPDLRLCADNHLIRTEYGLHERADKYKKLIRVDSEYPRIKQISPNIWERYVYETRRVVRRRVSTDVNKVADLPGFKYVVTSHEFKEADDGRERALFMLIHTLKSEYKGRKGEFLRYLIDWYKYSGGHKLTDRDIINKLNYHWKRDYTISERYLNELLESIGKADMVDKE